MSESSYCVKFVLNSFREYGNADKLKIIDIPDTGYSYVCNYEEWKDWIGKSICWFPPDTLVDAKRPEFTFLGVDAKYNKESYVATDGSYVRVRAKKFRGIQSYGICSKIQDNIAHLSDKELWDYFDCGHYEPPISYPSCGSQNKLTGCVTSGETISGPKLDLPKYDGRAEGEGGEGRTHKHGGNAEGRLSHESGHPNQWRLVQRLLVGDCQQRHRANHQGIRPLPCVSSGERKAGGLRRR